MYYLIHNPTRSLGTQNEMILIDVILFHIILNICGKRESFPLTMRHVDFRNM